MQKAQAKQFDGAAVTFRRQREPFLVSKGESLTVFIAKLPHNIISY